MTETMLRELLSNHFCENMQLRVDNAAGHGKQKAQELQRKRQHSRIQSQHFMCRKPTRTEDDDGYQELSIDNSISNSAIPPPDIHAKQRRQQQRHTGISPSIDSTVSCREKLCSPTAHKVHDNEVAKISKAHSLDKTCSVSNRILDDASSTRNVCMPQRRDSVDDIEPVSFVDDQDCSDDNDPSRETKFLAQSSKSSRNDERPLSILAEILSILEL